RGHLVEEVRIHELQARLEELQPDHQGHGTAHEQHEEGEHQVHGPDVLVVRGEQPPGNPLGGTMVVVVGMIVVGGGVAAHLLLRGVLPRGGPSGPSAALSWCVPGPELPWAAGPQLAAAAVASAGCLRAASQVSNSSLGRASTTMGMKPWSLPQSSAHWPRYTPTFSMLVQASLTKPGMASCFQPSAGTHQAWITSSEVMTNRTLVSTGNTRRLSTSSR